MHAPVRFGVPSSTVLGETSSRSQSWLRSSIIVIAATALVALCAHVSIALPFTPVPVTMQTFAVLLVGMLLGPALGTATMLLYLAEGAAGLPVFSPHGLGGLAQLAGPSAGYLLFYPFAAWVAGFGFSAIRRFLPVFVAAAAAAILADSALLVAGSGWLSLSLHLTAAQALEMGAMPFLAGEACKLVLVSLVLAALERARQTPSR